MFTNSLTMLPAKYFNIIVSLGLLFPTVSFAQNSNESDDELYDDFPVVLTATRLKQTKNNLPASTTIIDREMIDASGFTEIADLLRLVPGMLVNYDSGHIPAVGYQFLLNRYSVRFQIIVDGMSVYTPLFGEVPWTQLGVTIDDIERIEVVRGPSSASYGPNAMTGVISIITRHALLDKGIKLKVIQGQNGRSEQFMTLADGLGDLDYKVSIAARNDDGFEQRYDGKNLNIANIRGDYQAGNNDLITLSLQYNNGHFQEDGADINYSMPEHTKEITQTSYQAKWIHSFSTDDNFTLHYYKQQYDDDNSYIGDYSTDGLGFVFTDERVKTDRENIEMSYSKYSDAYSLTIGGLYRIDNTITPQYLYNVDKDIKTRQFFINTELRLDDDNLLNLNLLRDDNDTGGASLSPRIAFNHQFSKNHSARIAYAESCRSPFVLEEYTNYVVYVPAPTSSNVTIWTDKYDLMPEKIKTWDISYLANINKKKTELDFRLYRNEISDLIVLDNSFGTGGFEQGDGFFTRGFEATISHKFDSSKLIINYAKTRISASDLVLGDPIWYESGAPDNNASLLFIQKLSSKLTAALGYYYTGSYQQLCCEASQQDSRKRLDINISKRFKIAEYHSEVKFVLQNITDEEVDTRLYNNYQQQAYVSLSMKL